MFWHETDLCFIWAIPITKSNHFADFRWCDVCNKTAQGKKKKKSAPYRRQTSDNGRPDRSRARELQLLPTAATQFSVTSQSLDLPCISHCYGVFLRKSWNVKNPMRHKEPLASLSWQQRRQASRTGVFPPKSSGREAGQTITVTPAENPWRSQIGQIRRFWLLSFGFGEAWRVSNATTFPLNWLTLLKTQSMLIITPRRFMARSSR